jgi:hypothetical protein
MIILFYFLMCVSAAAQVGQHPPVPPQSGNFVYVEQVGDGNILNIDQMDSDHKQAAFILQGDNNLGRILQSGAGNHTAIITQQSSNAQNNNNVLGIRQSGSGANMASIILTNPVANNGNYASIMQAGNAGAEKQFTLQLNGSGINATVVQDNLSQADRGSLSISCVAPPCSASYVKH